MFPSASSYPNDPYAGSGGGPKVAISRLHQNQSSTTGRRRVARACTACREHKIKCSGDSPPCKHCASAGRTCEYISTRKDRLKIVTDRCSQMAGYLKTLSHFASDGDAEKIGELLENIEADAAEFSQGQTPSSINTDGESSRESHVLPNDRPDGSQHVDTESQVHLDEDLHHNDRSRATGFVGISSEIQWLRTLLLPGKLDNGPNPGRGYSFQASSYEQVSQVSFYLDASDVDFDFVDETDVPTLGTAKQLLVAYMENVHDSFPILPKQAFESQVIRYFRAVEEGREPRVAPKWRAVLNLVFAIGARYSSLSNPGWTHDKDEFNHKMYQARAQKAGWNEITLSQPPDLLQIQVGGLLGFYFLSTGQVSRAWLTAGMALRFAQSLGLHVRNEDPIASGHKREAYAHVWWSLSSLDRQLGVLTGRPGVVESAGFALNTSVAEERSMGTMNDISNMSKGSSSSAGPSVSIPTYTGPHPMTGIETPNASMGAGRPAVNPGSYFRALSHMASITQTILSSVYSVGGQRPQGELQKVTSQLGQRLDHWAASLPAKLDFQNRDVFGTHDPSDRQRIMLGFQFYGAKILLTRPCLGRMVRLSREEDSSTAASKFSRDSALLCVQAAKAELDLLPNQPDAQFIYKYAPWWSCVHYLMQAVASLLLALSSTLFPRQDLTVLADYAKKAIRWLRSMYDVLAYRAYLVAMDAYQVVANELSLDMTDLWNEHAAAYPHIDPTVVGAGVSQMDFASFPVDTSPMLPQGRYDSNTAMPLPRPAGPSFGSSDAVAASFGLSVQPSRGLYDETFYGQG